MIADGDQPVCREHKGHGRHLEIVRQLDDRFTASLPLTTDRREVGIIADDNVRMGHLAFVGSHKVNGVSALHTDLMKQTVFRGLHEVFPERIVNQTNGVTPRRWRKPGSTASTSASTACALTASSR